MSNVSDTLIGICIPVIGTASGAAMVFFLRREMNPKLQKFLLGFAAGVMIAASVWSLLIPSVEMSKNLGNLFGLPAAVGFLAGIGFLLFLERIILRLPSLQSQKHRNPSAMMILAVAIHNLPEGMTVGIVFAGVTSGNSMLTLSGAFSLAIGIAIQNFPEGAIVSMPLLDSGFSKKRAFTYGFLSGIIEPVGAILTLLLTSAVEPLLPYILAFAAGAMVYAVVEELIPKAREGEHSSNGILGFTFGFLLMMLLDIYLG